MQKALTLCFAVSCFLVVHAIACLSAMEPSTFQSGPNIVYILADDLGFGDVQCLNPTRCKIPTPHLDRLTSQGMTFTDAHSGSSVCTPTRYGLLTGRYAWRTRLQNGVLDGTDDPPLIAADRLTVPGLLKRHGYSTAVLGKWHLGFLSERQAEAQSSDLAKRKGGQGGLPVGSRIIDGPITRGFDYFWGCSNARTMSGLVENDLVIENIQPIAMLPRLEKRAVDYISEHAQLSKTGHPFFLYLPLTSPHSPILPTAEWQGKSVLGSYGDFVMQTDAVVGRVLESIDQSGISDNTLVIFTSDNGCSGPAARTDQLERLGHFASAQFRGYKADIWEGGHRVPFFARWPSKIKPGTKSSHVICHTDLLATLSELLGETLPDNAGEDSFSILPWMLGNHALVPRQAIVHHSISGLFSIRKNQWKLNLCSGSGGWTAPKDAEATQLGLADIQLYDLTADVAETNNVQAQHPAVVAELTQLLESYVANGRSTTGKIQSNDSEVSIHKEVKSRDKANRVNKANSN
jgi:arylsulfatase A